MSTASKRALDFPGLILRFLAIGYVTLLVLLPLFALAHRGLSAGPGEIVAILTNPITADALWLSFWTALLVTTINAVMGTATAWVLVRYPLPGKRLLSAFIDLPFAMPTMVTGVLLVTLFGPDTFAGNLTNSLGISITYAKPAIIFCLAFITFPFVIRSLTPVLAELDPAEEEAAKTLGAGRFTTFFRVLVPPLLPALGCGMVQSFARSLAEFGSIAVASGNMPLSTLTASVHVLGEMESGRTESAAVISLVLLSGALLLVFLTRYLEKLAGARNA